MLTVHPEAGAGQAGPQAGAETAPKVSWIDLFDPSPQERAEVESLSGLPLPTRSDLSEVEYSSRIYQRNGVLIMSVPGGAPSSGDEPPAPIGFVLSEDLLVTLRYEPMRAFDCAAERFAGYGSEGSSAQAFVILIEELVDATADMLEDIAAQLDRVSRLIFRQPTSRRSGRRGKVRSNETLRNALNEIGDTGERLSQARGRTVGLQRIIPFASDPGRAWVPHDMQSRLRVAQKDLASLSDYDTHLSSNVQFLLDAVLGFINTNQNEIFTVLTVVSVIGIPPTLIASIYGMNFRNMPELDWAWGYQFGLAMILLSTLLPIMWFRWRGWL